MKKGIYVSLIGLYGFVAGLVYYIMSAIANYESDEYGTSFSYGNKDILILVIMSFFLICLGLIYIYEKRKGVKVNYATSFVVGLDSVIGGLYYLTTGIKYALKGKAPDTYFTLAGLGLVILLFAIYLFKEEKKRQAK